MSPMGICPSRRRSKKGPLLDSVPGYTQHDPEGHGEAAVSQVPKPAQPTASPAAVGRGTAQPTGKSAIQQTGMSALRRADGPTGVM